MIFKAVDSFRINLNSYLNILTCENHFKDNNAKIKYSESFSINIIN